MDPDANLAEQRTLAKKIARGSYTHADSDRLAELVIALDEWIANGGFLPKAWRAS